MRVSRKIAAALAVAAATTAATTAGATTAGATTAGATTATVAPAAVAPAAAATGGGQESTLEAAFLAIVDPAPPSQIQAHFTVPAVQCTGPSGIEDATAQVNALPGPSGRAAASISSGAVRTPGLVTAAASVEGGCLTGSALYQAQALGVPLAMTVSPGDKVLLTASFDPATQRRTATVDDLTTGVSLTQARTDSGGFAPFSDFAGVKRSGREPVPDFGVIHWSKVTINGAPISSAAALFGFSLIRSIAHPRVLIRTSKLSAAGDAFTNTWVAGS